jgi:Deacetylases, including yeast histone deacetylase and acetoin utilization protein
MSIPISGMEPETCWGGDPDVTHVNFHSGMTDNENREWNNYDYGIGGATDEVFMNKLEAVLNRPFDFEFLILIFGHDSHNDDYGPFRLSQAAYPFLGSLMHRIAGGKPTLMVLSGGLPAGSGPRGYPRFDKGLY